MFTHKRQQKNTIKLYCRIYYSDLLNQQRKFNFNITPLCLRENIYTFPIPSIKNFGYKIAKLFLLYSVFKKTTQTVLNSNVAVYENLTEMSLLQDKARLVNEALVWNT